MKTSGVRASTSSSNSPWLSSLSPTARLQRNSNHGRGSFSFDPTWNGLSDLFDLKNDPQQNVFLVKLNYYLNL